MRINVPQLPNRVRPNLKSIGQTAKQVATMVNGHIRNGFNNQQNPYQEQDITFTTQNDQKKYIFKKDSIYSNFWFDYQTGQFRQSIVQGNDSLRESLGCEVGYCNIMSNNISVTKHCSNEHLENDPVYQTYFYWPPQPYLNITKDTGVWETCYAGSFTDDDRFQDFQRDFVNHQWSVGSPKAIYAKQYKMITKFLHLKNEAVGSVTNAYKKLADNANYEGEIFDLSAKGDRVEVKKQQGEQGAAFDVTFYDEEDKKTMNGTFEIAKDENGKPLKEAEDGTILKFGDPNYDDEQNELCFNVSNLNAYYEDIGRLNYAISRKVVKVNNKYKNEMTMTMYDRNGTVEDSYSAADAGNKAISRCSQDWLDKRFSKVYYNSTKHDLKQLKHDLLSMRLNPADIGLPPDSPDSLISQINADNLDSNYIRTPQPVAQEVQEAQDAQNAAREAFLANLAQEKPESYVAFNEYMVNMEPEERNSILDFSFDNRLNILRDLLRRNAPEAIEAFEAFEDFMKSRVTQDPDEANIVDLED